MTLLKYSPLLHHCSMSLSKKRKPIRANFILSGARLRGKGTRRQKSINTHARTHTHTPVSKVNKQNNKRLQNNSEVRKTKQTEKISIKKRQRKKDEKCNEIFHSFFL